MASAEIEKLIEEISQLRTELQVVSDHLTQVQVGSYFLWTLFSERFSTDHDRKFVADILGISEEARGVVEEEAIELAGRLSELEKEQAKATLQKVLRQMAEEGKPEGKA